MISLRELVPYGHLDEEIKIVCIDGQVIIGMPDSVDDEEDSGIDEPGITVCTPDGIPMVIGLSEIDTISTLSGQLIQKYAMA